jgi:hypothetical protein
MKKRSYMESSTLSKVGNDPIEKDLNKLEEEDQVLSVSDLEKSDQKKDTKTVKGHSIEKRIKELCSEVEKLTASTNWEPAKNKFDSAKQEINKIDSDGKYEKLNDKFNEFYKIFERRYNNHMMVKEAIELKEDLCKEIESLTEKSNHDDAIKCFEEIERKWNNCKTIPDRFEEILEKKYKDLCIAFNSKKDELKSCVENNISIEKILEKCCNDAEALLTENNLKKASSKLKHLEQKWAKFVSDATDIDLIKNRFESAVKLFETKKNEYIGELENKKNEIHEKAGSIILLLEECLKEKRAKDVLYKVKELQKDWDKLEKAIIDNELSRQFSRLIKKYFSNLKFIQQKEDWARWENYTNKLLLCEEAEKLLDEQDNFKVAREIKIIWEKWRKIGQAPREKNDEIWVRFNGTRQKLKIRSNDFFSNLKEERGGNTEKKKQLCVKAEELSNSTDWETTAEELKQIQTDWKNIGPAEKVIDDELYERFRNACNKFFENRIEFYKKLHHKQAVNKNDKRDLIDDAERLKELYWKDAIKEIKYLRNQWKRIGSANRQDEQKLWNRFNTVIENYLDDLDNSRPENLSKKDEVCSKISTLIKSLNSEKENAIEINDQIEDLKAEWKSIGPVPRENEIDIQNKYDELINNLAESFQGILEKKAVKVTHNKKQKEDILFKIETLAKSEAFEENEEEYKIACNEWDKLSGNCVDVVEEKLDARFKEICSAFDNKKSDYFKTLSKEKDTNLKNKIKICVELEKLTDIRTSKDALENEKNDTFLAQELMFAIKGNFATDTQEYNSEDSYTKFKKLQKKWMSIGPVPIENFENINLRYNKICSNIESKIK